MFFWRLTIQNNTHLTSTFKEHSTTMATPMDESPNEHHLTFIDIANTSFSTDPYKWQYELGGMALEAVASNNPFCLLCVRPTGGGKSLLYQVLALHFKKVTLVISPILALGSDQMRKILNVPDRRLTALHLDEMSDVNLTRLKGYLEKLHYDNAVILLSSPQFLEGRGKDLLRFLHASQLIQFVVMDELHLSHHFGWSCRSQFKCLKPLLFNKLPAVTPILLMTATCSLSIVSASEELFGFSITSHHWPSAFEMANRKQSFEASYSTVGIRYVKRLLHHYLTVQHVDSNDEQLPSKFMFYANTAKSIKGLSETLEEFLDSNQETKDIDVLLVHGNLSKEEKGAFISAFTNNNISGMNFKIMCSTSGVANAGIDCKDVRAVFRLDLPSSVFDLVQEMGRAGRRDNATGEHYHYHLFFSIENLIYLYKRIMSPDEECDDPTYREVQICDLFDVISILANPFQCHKQLIEMLLGDPDDDASHEPFPSCGYCSVCNHNVEMWPALCMEGCQLVLSDVFSSIQGNKNLNNITNAIKRYPNAQRHLFGVNSDAEPKPIEIKNMLFLLVAADIIDLKYEPKTDTSPDTVTLSLAKKRLLRPGTHLMDEGYWTCILTRESVMNYDE